MPTTASTTSVTAAGGLLWRSTRNRPKSGRKADPESSQGVAPLLNRPPFPERHVVPAAGVRLSSCARSRSPISALEQSGDFYRLASGKGVQRFEQLRNKRLQVGQSVRRCDKCCNCEIEPSHIVVVPKLAVDGDENIELHGGQREKFAVPLPGSTHARDGADIVAHNVLCQPPVDALVKQNLHVMCSSRSCGS
jgi:hypothetical protein